MSTIKSHTELLPPQLAERILALSPFKNITQDQFRTFLQHLLEVEHLEHTEIGGLIVGFEAEKIVNNYRFFATFEDEIAYRVRDKSREIGTIQSAPEIGSTIGLAGFAWRIVDVDTDKQVIHVERAKGKVKTLWTGGGIQIHTRILQKIRDTLLSDTEYSYLHERTLARLQIARNQAYKHGLANSSILPLAPNKFLIFPWCGTRQFSTQMLILADSGMNIQNSFSPYYYELTHEAEEVEDLKEQLIEIFNNRASPKELVEDIDDIELQRYKYDRYVPIELLREAYAHDFIDIDGAFRSLQMISNKI